MKIISPGSAYAPGQTPYDIFKDRMTAISQIATGIKSMISNKYINNQITMIADNILNKIDKTKSVDLISLITGKVPNEIYPSDPSIEETVGQFIDKFAMGPMMQKETMMGGLQGAPTGQPTGQPAGLPAVGETRIPTTSVNQLYKTISEMPSGDVNWANLYKEMSQKKPWFMGQTGPEGMVVEQMMGQLKDPRAKLEADLKLTQLAQETLYPATEEEKITSEIDFFRKDPEGYASMLKLKQDIIGEKKTAWETEAETLLKWYEDDIININEVKKGMGIYIAPEKRSDFNKKFDLLSQMNITTNEWKKFFGVYIPEEGAEGIKVKYYKTSAEVIASEPKIKGMTIDPTFSSKGWYANYVKVNEAAIVKDYLYTKKNLFGEISNIGIIPPTTQYKISNGQPLTNEEKTIIRNNHNLQKSLLSESALINVENILKQIGVPLKVDVTLPTGQQSLLSEAPAMKVTDESKLAMIPTMTDDELHNALISLYEPSDTIYKALYNEAVKRGLIPK